MKIIFLKITVWTLFFLPLFFSACEKNELASSEDQNSGEFIKLCTEMHLPGEQETEDRAIGFANKFWINGQTLRIKMIGGSAVVRGKVQQHANRWLTFANLKFTWVTSGDAEIRITFIPGGSWSYIGTGALSISQADPTMNFGWFYDNTADTEFSRTVLHEFGHAIGLVHEHQHPFRTIPWDVPAVYAYYLQTNNWDQDQVNQNVLTSYGTNGMIYTAFDPSSIMEYSVPNSITIGNYEIGWNINLSAVDKSFIRERYPFPSMPITLNQFVSFKSSNITNNYIRHYNWLGFINPIVTNLDKLDATFKVVQGLDATCPTCISLESKNFPGHYLRHELNRVKIAPFQNTAVFKGDASFYPRAGLNQASNYSFESRNFPGEFIRHRAYELWKDPQEETALYKSDASFLKVTPLVQ